MVRTVMYNLPRKNLHTLLQCHSCNVAQSRSDSQLINPVVIFVIIKTRKRGKGGFEALLNRKG